MTTILNKERILEQARIFIDEGKYDKAITEYEKILLADPSDLRVKLRVAELHTKRKQIGEAIRIYREVADAYTVEGFFLKAVTVLKNILRLNPTLVDVNLMLAELYERMGLNNDALRQYDILATTLDQKGEAARALEIRKKIVDLTPTSESARVRYAEMLQREGHIEEAMDQYEEIAGMYEKDGRKDLKTADIYEKILSHRDNINMLRSLCHIYIEMGEKKKVLKCIDAAKNIASYDPELLGIQARIFAELNQIETARTKYLALAEVERDDGNIEGSLKAYAEILVLIPGEEERVLRRAEELGEEAIAKLRKIVEKRRREESDKAKKEEERLKKEDEARQKEAEKHEAEIQKQKQEKKQAAKEKARQTIKKEETSLKKEEQKPPLREKVAPPAQSQGPNEMMRDAEAALNLAKAYLRMELKAEAVRELEKARVLFEKLTQVQGPNQKRSHERLNEIKNLMTPQKKTETAAAAAAAPKEKKETAKPKSEPAEATPKESEKKGEKKKISFV